MVRSWGVKDLSSSAPAYKKLAVLLAADLRFIKVFGDCIKAEDVDAVAKSIVQITEVMKRSLPMLRVMTMGEFERNTNFATIFRLQSLASRTMGTYVQKVGHVYLNMVIGEMLQRLMDTKLQQCLEIDPYKAGPDCSVEELAWRKSELMRIAQQVLDRITSTSVVDGMPRGMRAACHFISTECQRREHSFSNADRHKLIGGFIMLRYFNPALLTPEAFGLLPPGRPPPSGNVRRNLILVTKLLQNLSNNVMFGNKETFMADLNPFLLLNGQRMRSYLDTLPRDPLGHASGRAPWFDLEERAEDLEVPRDLRNFDLHHFVTLHRLFVRHRADLEKCDRDVSLERTNADTTLGQVFEQLGEPPQYRDTKTGKMPASAGVGGVSLSLDARIGQRAQQPDNAPGESVPPCWEETGFFYAGPPSLLRNMVLYLVLRRFSYEWLDRRWRDGLTRYMEKVLEEGQSMHGSKANQKFDMVVDLSWTAIPDHLVHKVMNDAKSFIESLDKKWRKRVNNVYVVNPNRLFFLARHILKQSDRKLKRNHAMYAVKWTNMRSPSMSLEWVREIYYWKMLYAYVEEGSLLLPPETQCYFPECVSVDRIPARLSQEAADQGVSFQGGIRRILKISHHNILEIDPTQQKIKETIALSSIDEISADRTMITIQLEGKKRSRCYGLQNMQEVEHLVNEILQACAELNTYGGRKTEFAVQKVNRKGVPQTRILISMPDCLLNIKQNTVRGVIPLLGLREAEVRGDTLVLTYKAQRDVKDDRRTREFKMKNISEAESLKKDVEEGMQREDERIEKAIRDLKSNLGNQSFVSIFLVVIWGKRLLRRARLRPTWPTRPVLTHRPIPTLLSTPSPAPSAQPVALPAYPLVPAGPPPPVPSKAPSSDTFIESYTSGAAVAQSSTSADATKRSDVAPQTEPPPSSVNNSPSRIALDQAPPQDASAPTLMRTLTRTLTTAAGDDSEESDDEAVGQEDVVQATPQTSMSPESSPSSTPHGLMTRITSKIALERAAGLPLPPRPTPSEGQ